MGAFEFAMGAACLLFSMEASLAAVQKRLAVLFIATLAVLLVSLPRPANRRLIGAFEEVDRFRASFVESQVEEALRTQAAGQGLTPIAQVEGAIPQPRMVKFKATGEAPPIAPIVLTKVATLAQAAALGQPGSSLGIGVIDAAALGPALAWRFARSDKPGPFVIKAVELVAAEVGAADVELEREVAKLRVQSLEERAAVESATRRLETVEERVKFQSKARSKYLGKSLEARQEARVALEEKTSAHAATQARYDQQASSAMRPRNAITPLTVPAFALARVTADAGGETIKHDIPVPVMLRQVPVTPLAGADFAATRAAGLWDEVKDKDPAGAVAAVRGYFNWHMLAIPLGPIELSGSYVLQVVPLVLPVLLWLLLGAIRRAATSYSPFSTKVPEKAPRIGLKNRFLELLVLMVLPLAAVACAITALLLIHRIPGLPGLAGLACFTLGGYAFSELRDLREQTERIVHTHSLVPPEPVR
jgi:hypothetical protein